MLFGFGAFGEQDRIRADQESYLRQHPEIASLLNGFIRTVVERKPADVFEFAKQHFAGDRDSRDRWAKNANGPAATETLTLRCFVCSRTRTYVMLLRLGLPPLLIDLSWLVS